jgi:hypothetical protein
MPSPRSDQRRGGRGGALVAFVIMKFQSFISGHTLMAFTGAGLICAHHSHLPLYGGGVPVVEGNHNSFSLRERGQGVRGVHRSVNTA